MVIGVIGCVCVCRDGSLYVLMVVSVLGRLRLCWYSGFLIVSVIFIWFLF